MPPPVLYPLIPVTTGHLARNYRKGSYSLSCDGGGPLRGPAVCSCLHGSGRTDSTGNGAELQTSRLVPPEIQFLYLGPTMEGFTLTRNSSTCWRSTFQTHESVRDILHPNRNSCLLLSVTQSFFVFTRNLYVSVPCSLCFCLRPRFFLPPSEHL